jgi:hypothetical protein
VLEVMRKWNEKHKDEKEARLDI